MHILRHSAQGRIIIKLQSVAGSEPSANRIGNMDSVAIDRRSIHGDCDLYDFERK